jgi:HSP20 family protein
MTLSSFRSFDPFDRLPSLQSTLDRLLEGSAFGPSFSSGPNVFPPINVFSDKEGALVVRAEAPGIDPETLDVKVEPRRLTLTGERKLLEGTGSIHRRERQTGKFSRTVQLPDELDPESVTANYRDGVLTVRIPKHAAAKPRRIEVRTA